MKSEKEISLLKDAGCSDKVIEHVIAVAEAALDIADEIKMPVDMELVRLGSLLHDIGRAKTHKGKGVWSTPFTGLINKPQGQAPRLIFRNMHLLRQQAERQIERIISINTARSRKTMREKCYNIKRRSYYGND